MFGIVLSALNAFMGPMLLLLVKSILVRFGVMFALFFVVTGFIEFLSASGVLPTAASLQGIFGGVPSVMSYFLSIFGIYKGVGMIFSAYTVRFIIRRIPVIG